MNLNLGTIQDVSNSLPYFHFKSFSGSADIPTSSELRLAWKFNKMVELNIVGQNLVNSSHTEFMPSSPSPKSVERSVYIKVACRL